MGEVDHTIIRRLAFAKYLYGLGARQAEVASPLDAAALLILHDSVELFLQIGSELLDAGARQVEFMAYWDLLSAKLPEGTELGSKEAMRRMNKARVALKHHGITPSKQDVQGFVVSVRQFLDEATTVIFGRDFAALSLIEFVRPDTARERLGYAQKWVDAGKRPDRAVDQAAEAFRILLHDYEERKKQQWFDKSPFFFGEDLEWLDSRSVGLQGDPGWDKMAEFVDKVGDSLQAIRDAVRVLALGIDYRRYSRFRLLTPDVRIDRSGKTTVWRMGTGNPTLEATLEDAAFCIDFVIEAAVQLQEFDYSLESTEESRGVLEQLTDA